MNGIDRDALSSARRRIAVLYMAGIGGEGVALDLRLAIDEIDAALALVEPVAFTRDRVRAELTASLPADPKWVAWVDGVLDRLEATS